MKTKLFMGLIAFAMVAISATAQQQRRPGNNPQGCILQDDLTQEQKDKMDELRIAFYQKTKADHNQLNELRARKQTLQTSDPVDEKALMECLSSINTIQTKLQQERIRHFQEVKANLTDDQVIVFDARNKGPKGPYAQGKGFGSGKQGQCQGCNQNGFGRGKGQRGNGQGFRDGQGQGRRHGQQAGQRRGASQGRRLDGMDLTDVQKEFMDQSRLQMMKKEQVLKNKLNELNAQLKTQTTGKEIDLKQADKLIAEQSKVKLEMAQLRAEHRIEVRKQLTEEQKVLFDSHQGYGKGRYGRL